VLRPGDRGRFGGDGSSEPLRSEGFEKRAGRTADPSTSLRDDKGRGVTQVGVVSGWQSRKSPLRYAPVATTNLFSTMLC
jgi:hypothetical protein